MGWVEVWDQLAFTKLQALFVVGETKKLNPSDLPALPQSDSASELSRTAFAEWDASRSLLRSLWAVSRRHMLLSAPHAFLYVLCQIALPVVLQALLVWISGPSNANILIGAFYVALLFAIRLISTAVFRPQTFSLGSRAGIRAERTVMLLVSRKLLRLRGGARGTGEIVSALATDAKRFGPELLCFFHWIWTTPLQLMLAIVLLFHFIGPAATAAFVVLVLSTCVMWVVARRERFLFDIVLKRSDARIRALSGLLDILRQAKMAGWEDVLARDVRGERVRQMEAIGRSLATQAVGRSMFAISPAFTCAVAFAAVGVVPGSPALTSKVVFPVLALFEMIRVPIRIIPSLAAKIMQALVSAGRLQQFLEEDEYCGRLIMDDGGRSDVAGGVDGGLIGWIGPTEGEEDDKPDSETRPLALVNGKTNYGAIVAKESNGTVNQEIQMLEFSPVLRNVQLVLERGSLIIVRGPVGAGKSSLLSALLGEMTYRSDDPAFYQPPWLNGNFVAYTTQTPWIQNATVRDNILFRPAPDSFSYEPVDESRYRKTISACGLLPDIESMPAGDATEIGERGTTLSGGQRARIALARAVYAAADCYLLDDPLSALDAHVGEQVFSRVFERGGMLDGKTRVLVTHRDDLCLRADWIVHMEEGEVLQVSKGGTVNPLLALASNPDPIALQRDSSELKLSSNGVLVEEEHRASGSVGVQLYSWYLTLAGIAFPIASITGMVVMQSIFAFSDFWLSLFASATETYVKGHGPTSSFPYADSMHFIRLYLLLTFSASIVKLVTEITMSYVFVWCSTASHELLLDSLLTAPVSWLDRTPVGRILGRFSGDIMSLDTDLREAMTSFAELGISVVITYIVISMVTPSVLLVAPVICFVYVRMLRYYGKTKRDLARINSTRHSIVLSKFSEVASGLHVIRAFGKQEPVLRNIFGIVDKYSQASLPNEQAIDMFIMLSSVVASFVVLAAAVAAVSARNVIGPALSGLVLTWSLTLTNPMPYFALVAGRLDSDMIIVERIKEYIYEIPTEKEKLYGEGDQLLRDSGWPQRGHIELKNVSMRYRSESPIVLKSLSVTFPAGKKIGVVGRTGAGKSSILNVLLRITEACGGSVTIDGVNIADVGLSLLRSSISTVPQDPGLFHGTLEANLDPRGAFSKAAVHKALKTVGMERSHSLSFEVAHAGANLSAGERQLVCVARALLTKSRIVVLDEASSYVDYERDRFLQEALRVGLAESTVIVIAHRIHTVVECDLVVVMDDGEVVEGPRPPVEMLKDDRSRLFALASELGRDTFEELFSVAASAA